MRINVFMCRIERRCDGRGYIQMTGLHEFNEHGQVRAVEDAAILRATSAQGQIGWRTAKHIRHDHDAVARINGICRVANFILFQRAIILGANGNSRNVGLWANDVLYR